MQRSKENIEREIEYKKREIELLKGFNKYHGELSFLYYQLKELYNELKKVNENEVYNGFSR